MSTSKRKKEANIKARIKQNARQQRELELSLTNRKDKEFVAYDPEITYRRPTPEYKSLKTTLCDTSRQSDKRYTGDYITGITIVHKSGLAPVSRGIDPKDYATMRR